MGRKIFVSYRRDDSSAAARGLRQSLIEVFGDTVFMDVSEIRVGVAWPAEIEKALDSAAVLLVVIGQAWLKLSDIHGRRRLDQPGDWVRLEIERSLERGIPTIPVLVEGGKVPPLLGLPDSIVGMLNYKANPLRETDWEHDLKPLIDRLVEPPLSFAIRGEKEPLPKWPGGRAPDLVPRKLTREEIDSEIFSSLPAWKIVTGPIPGEYSKTRTELSRRYEFKSFVQAVAFMQAATAHINTTNHHPRWENLFKTVTVWLTTWDIGHDISRLDLDLAHYLDSLYKDSIAKKAAVA